MTKKEKKSFENNIEVIIDTTLILFCNTVDPKMVDYIRVSCRFILFQNGTKFHNSIRRII